MRRRRMRFSGAGGSAEREFKRRRRQNIRDEWFAWLVTAVGIVGFFVWSLFLDGHAARAMDLMSGVLVGVSLALWALGGHISAFHWWLGAEGEKDTAKEIERLGTEWHCEHDLEHEHGNWDHVLVGPPGVFLLDSKRLNGTAAAGGDALRSGRLRYAGGVFRSGAKEVNQRLEQRLGNRAPWVQAVVIVWGEFPQGEHKERDVVYVSGDKLREWLSGQPEKVNAPQRAALVTALREVRTTLTSQ